MQKVLSFLALSLLVSPTAFALTGSGTSPAPILPSAPAQSGSSIVSPIASPSVPAPQAVTPPTNSAPIPTPSMSSATAPTTPSMNLGEARSVSCSSNPAFATNSCDQCFDGGSVTVGKRLTGLFDNWTNPTSSLLIAYKDEQKTPNMVAFGNTTWTSSPVDDSKIWKYGADIIWTPVQAGSSKMQYILPGGQKVRFIEADFAAGYTLAKSDRKNGDLVGVIRFPLVSHTVDASGNEGSASTHYECISYALSAPVAPVTPEKPKPTPAEQTRPQTGPTETIVLILAAFFIAFGLMFSLRKRI